MAHKSTVEVNTVSPPRRLNEMADYVCSVFGYDGTGGIFRPLPAQVHVPPQRLYPDAARMREESLPVDPTALLFHFIFGVGIPKIGKVGKHFDGHVSPYVIIGCFDSREVVF